VCSERALLIPYDTHLIVTEFMYQHVLCHEHLASNLTSLRRARDTPTRSQTAQDELAIGTTARPAVQIGRTRAPLTRVSWDARRTGRRLRARREAYTRRTHAGHTHAPPPRTLLREPPRDVATVGGLHPRRPAAADLLEIGGR